MLVVGAGGGQLTAPRARAVSSGELRGNTVYAVFTEGASPAGVYSTGTATWSEIAASPWAQELDDVL